MNELALAEKAALRLPRIFVDWSQWWSSGEPEKHRIYLGVNKMAWDDCCGRQICDLVHEPYPELALLGPYLRIIRQQSEVTTIDHPHLLARHAPLFWDVPCSGELVYVDLTRAYWSIYTRATLDVQYDGLQAPVQGLVKFLDAEHLGERRLLRNALLGSIHRNWRRGIDHGEPFRESVPAALRRPNLWGLVMDCLELVAWEMRLLGAVYVHTDGFIFPHKDLAADAIELLRNKFQLTATVRASGVGTVSGMGRWHIGEIVHGQHLTEPSTRIDSMIECPKDLADHLTRFLLS